MSRRPRYRQSSLKNFLEQGSPASSPSPPPVKGPRRQTAISEFIGSTAIRKPSPVTSQPDNDDQPGLLSSPEQPTIETIQLSEEDDEPMFLPRRQKKRVVIPVSDSESDEEPPRQRRRLVQANRRDREASSSSENEVLSPKPPESDDDDHVDKEEIDFLHENVVYEGRTRERKQSKYSQALEKLKRREKGSFHGAQGPLDAYRSRTLDDGTTSDDEDDEDNEKNESAATISISSSSSGDEEAFVVDDDVIDGMRITPPGGSGAIVEHAKAELPAEFSLASSDHEQNFETYVEFIVHRLNGDEEANQPQFVRAERAVERRLQSYAASLLDSDSWFPEYKKALDTYPHFVQGGAHGLECEGCRQRKPASVEVRLYCRPEETDVSPNEQSFSLGRSCYARGKLYHRLVHFGSYLDTKVREEIHRMVFDGILPAKDGSSTFEVLRDTGTINKMYTILQQLLEDASSGYIK
ncbi:hypothetical protein BCR43DRAFT_486288 [Syncephalastrum racemosum]|uniref:DUF4211 domain-containing protein n=1 Tax=Syncephalastrum racemosum TaxID=13706 RepID=A0A1X2HQ82_SYNRA|nr:hypothetical protein BCR43DRAFT_486288 [Syncephalastrum racemosum]